MFITRRNCIRHFNKYRPQEKSMQLFATNTKTRTVKRSSTCVPVFDIKKETASFMQYIDYARIRNYDIENLLHYQLTTMSFFSYKRWLSWKPKKIRPCNRAKEIV